MNCEDFEPLMAEALGGELSEADRAAFETHLTECARCREDYETSRRTLDEMRSLPSTRKVTARREGDRLVIEEVTPVERAAPNAREAAAGATGPRSIAAPTGTTPTRRGMARWFASPLRYAAGLFIAFTAGYGLHAGLTLADAVGPKTPIVESPGESAPSFEGSLVRAYTRNPGRSDLAKCLIAMSPTRP